MDKRLERILPRVQKPARYTGGEYNQIIKDKTKVDIRLAFCFPDTYEIGMSNLGMSILYHTMNSLDYVWCERVYAPWGDMYEEMKKANIPLYALESGDALGEFDAIAFSIGYEMAFTTVLDMLDMGGIPLRSADRPNLLPIVMAGGTAATNAEPMTPFIDLFIVGEGEEVNNELLALLHEAKLCGWSKHDFLVRAAQIGGIYVPSLYDVEYNEDGTIKRFEANTPDAPDKVRKLVIRDMDTALFPDKVIVPYVEIVHDRIMLEMFRGCIRGCRFCQAGMIYRPVREKSPKVLLEQAKKLMDSTGYEEMSLMSLSTSDYRELPCFTEKLLELTEKEKVGLSLPSLRVDNFSIDLMNKVQKVRKSGLTFAPEAGTQRMRDVINKGVTEEDLLKSAKIAFEGGWSSVKLYFMIGLPYETVEDCKGIAHLAQKVVDEFFTLGIKGRRPSVTVSVSSFVPKAFTPFQWAGQNEREELIEKQKAIGDEIHSKCIRYNWHESKVSVLEGVFARGDRRLSDVIYRAVLKGCKFDGWDEYFDPEKWDEAFSEAGIDPKFYRRERSYDEILPWDKIDIGVTKEFLMRENENAKKGVVTPNCREKCSGCGARCFNGGVCFENVAKI